MTKKRGMAATYTEITLEDMAKFLGRGFRALHPEQGQARGEYYYDLKLGPFVGIRIWTSISIHSATGAGVGSDAIRIHLISLKDHGPLEKGKAPIVKRTQGWRNSLQERIEDLIEKYDDNEEFWENWAGTRQHGDPDRELRKQQVVPPQERTIPLEKLRGDITPPQIQFIRNMLRKITSEVWSELGLDKVTSFNKIPTDAELQTLSKRQGSEVIDTLLKAGYGNKRYATEWAEDL